MRVVYTLPVRKHLAIFKGTAAQDILSGKKTVEARFSKSKIAPYGVISAGDLVYIKPTGGEPIGQFKVKKVIFYDGMEESDLGQIKKIFGDEIVQDNVFWQAKKGSKYGTLIFIGECDPFLTSPIRIKKRDQRGWVVLD